MHIPTLSRENSNSSMIDASNKSIAADGSLKKSPFRKMKTNLRERLGNYKSSVRKEWQSLVDEMVALQRSYNQPGPHYSTGPLFAAQYDATNTTATTYSDTNLFYY